VSSLENTLAGDAGAPTTLYQAAGYTP